MLSFEAKVIEVINKYNMIENGDRILVGLSGGADSCALLCVLSSIAERFDIKITAAHLNHGIRGEEALRDQEFSKSFAKRYSIPFVTKNVSVPEYTKIHKLSSEEAGRQLRYEFFHEVCKKYNCNKIAVAHNMNDRAETVLLNIIRGSASRGFEGIKAVNNNIIRPLIESSRESIEEYAKDNNIYYVTDSTNSMDIYARNIVRNSIIPNMKKINPGALENIIRCSEIISLENEYIESVIENLSVTEKCDNLIKIDKQRFLSLHVSLKRRVIISALTKLCGSTQNVSLAQINALINNTSTGCQYSFGNGARCVASADEIIFSNTILHQAQYNYKINVPCVLNISETGIAYKFEFVSKYVNKPASICISLDNYDEENLTVRTRNDGDIFSPMGMNGTKKVKKFFIDCKIPSHERGLYPIIECKNKILAIFPLRVSKEARVTNTSKRILMITKLGGTYDKL